MSKSYLQKLILEILEEHERFPEDSFLSHIVKKLAEYDPKRIQERKVKPRYVVSRTIKRMIGDGIVTIKVYKKKRYVEMTPQGECKLSKMSGYEDLVCKRDPDRLRILITSFSEDQRYKRDLIRGIFKSLGFSQMRPGIWATNMECRALVRKLREDLSLTPNQLRLFVAEDSL